MGQVGAELRHCHDLRLVILHGLAIEVGIDSKRLFRALARRQTLSQGNVLGQATTDKIHPRVARLGHGGAELAMPRVEGVEHRLPCCKRTCEVGSRERLLLRGHLLADLVGHRHDVTVFVLWLAAAEPCHAGADDQGRAVPTSMHRRAGNIIDGDQFRVDIGAAAACLWVGRRP